MTPTPGPPPLAGEGEKGDFGAGQNPHSTLPSPAAAGEREGHPSLELGAGCRGSPEARGGARGRMRANFNDSERKMNYPELWPD